MPDVLHRLRKCFTGLYSLENQESQNVKQIIEKAIEKPENYVLKPQRQGGKQKMTPNRSIDSNQCSRLLSK